MAADKNLDANEVIKLLGLQPHPEGGHYRETFPVLASTGSLNSGIKCQQICLEGNVIN